MRITIHSDPVAPHPRHFAKTQQHCAFTSVPNRSFHTDVKKTGAGFDVRQLLSVLNLSTSPNQEDDDIMSIHSSSDESEEEILDSSDDEEEDSLSSRSPSLSPAPPSPSSVSYGQKRNIATVKSTMFYEERKDVSEEEDEDEDEDRGLAISIKRKKVETTPPRPSVVRAGTVAATNVKQATDLFGPDKANPPMKRRTVVRSSTISSTSHRTVFNAQPKPMNAQQSMFSAKSTTEKKPPSKLLRHKKLSETVTMEIRMGDLTEETSEAIVNAANGRLAHGGGVAGAISRKGGSTIQDESDDWIRDYGDVLTGDVAYTSAGDLPAKFVIHAVGPIWSARNAAKCENQLRMAVSNSLRCANQLGVSSISIPAISSGIFGFPKELCAEIMLEEVKKYANQEEETPTADETSTAKKRTLRTIRLVNFDDLTCNIFCEEFDQRFGS